MGYFPCARHGSLTFRNTHHANIAAIRVGTAGSAFELAQFFGDNAHCTIYFKTEQERDSMDELRASTTITEHATIHNLQPTTGRKLEQSDAKIDNINFPKIHGEILVEQKRDMEDCA